MATTLLNNAETQSSGTDVTTANSGGTNADAFNVAVPGTNMTKTYEATTPPGAHGSNCFKLALTSTATNPVYLGWNSTSWTATTEMWGAFYFRSNVGAVPYSGVRLVAFMNATAVVSGIKWPSGTGNFTFTTGTGWTDAGTASTQAISANTWYRFEIHVLFNSTTGTTGQGNIYTGDGTSLFDSFSIATTNMGAQCDEFRIGINTANFSITSGDYIALDSLNINQTGYPGPGPYSNIALTQVDPDGDNALGGWGTSPLWSKLNDASDATFGTATAS